MKKDAARLLLTETFDAPFDESQFTNFSSNLLNSMDTSEAFPYLSGDNIKRAFQNHVSEYRRLGSYTDGKGESIDVLAVKLVNEWAIERSRTMLRNFTADYLERSGRKDAALVAYFTDNPEDWRFSYIRMDYKQELSEKGKVRVKKELTPARRYSYLVGVNEPNHTAQSQLIGLLEDRSTNPTLTEIEDAFSVDAVSKQFYLDYRGLFERLHQELKTIVEADPKIKKEFESKSIDSANFAKKLLGQIVFLYFLQKKGWLGVGKDDSGNFKRWGTGPKDFLKRLFNKEYTDYKNFFNDVLEPLFYEALATDLPSNYFSRFDCKIPFLNGGLFEPLNNYNWAETDIRLDNDLMADVFNKFDQYNFTVRENEPLDKEVAIDPEMLGKVFENLLPENLRKGKGAYYTPRTIVHFMCQESLINYLKAEVPSIPEADVDTLIREGSLILEIENLGDKSSDTVLIDSLKDGAHELDAALANIKVCDPAIGSGAFPVGMLHEIVTARKVLELYLDKQVSIYALKRHCIQESIYGVDIDPGAVDIAKLRLWLSLVVDENDYNHIQALPNLDYKIMQGNSLIEEFHGISLNIQKQHTHDEELFSGGKQADAFSGGERLDILIQELHERQGEFFNADHPNDKRKKRELVETAILDIFHHELEKKRKVSSTEGEEIEADLKEMTHGNKTRNFFPWKLYYADIFRDNGGFDIVIGNPPYVSAVKHSKSNKSDREYYRGYYQELIGSFDLYTVFLLKTIDLLNASGSYSWIIPNGFLVSDYSKLVLELLQNYGFYRSIDVSNYNVFHDIGVYPIIILGKIGETDYGDYLITGVDDLKNNNLVKKKELFNYQSIKDFGIKIASGATGFQAKEIKKLIVNEPEKTETSIPFAVSGSVDPYIIQRNSVRYMGDTYFKPYALKNLEVIAKSKWKFWFNPKIVIAGMTKRIEAVYSETPLALGVGIYGIYHFAGYDPKYLLGILNSRFLTFYLNYKFKDKHLAGGYLAINKGTIEKLPFIEATLEQQVKLVKLIDQIMVLKKNDPDSEIANLQHEIDEIVYKIFNLTREEIAIVESS
ncbi:MAG: hypothetical protein HN757_11955 [Calditrichaeota bacterium]|jgi:adenine-specific DNA-methyltransferase|nr:hypothetical protein [Calditrichota bacterium]